MTNNVFHLDRQNVQDTSQEIQRKVYEDLSDLVTCPYPAHQESVQHIPSSSKPETTKLLPNHRSLTEKQWSRTTLRSNDLTPPKPQIPVIPKSETPTASLSFIQTSQIPTVQLPSQPSTPLLPRNPVTPIPELPTTPLPSLPHWAEKERGQYHIEQLKVMNPKQQLQYFALVMTWVIANIYFWYWWFFHTNHIGNPLLYFLFSVALFYGVTLLPSMYTFYLGQMRRPKAVDVAKAQYAGVVKRVAVISLTVPGSESLDFVKRQMIAMKNIHYPHDCWILVDKEHSSEIQALAEALGVFYFSRHDVAQWGHERVAYWNRPDPPFKAKTKAGNVNSWIDAYGHLYSHFTQLDIDHLPVPSYLEKVLGFFIDPKVKWIQAPSVYGNLGAWTARGSAEQEFVLQGPLQMGFFGFCRTPFIIGSHCTYDMEAIKEIGGFQPTRAEDHLDTVFLAAKGYQGVFLPEVIAVGDGPESFETYIGQQFAWAFSMIQVLFTYTPKCLKHYTPRQALQFLFVQTWYTFWSTSMLLLFILPIIALLTNSVIAHVNYWQYLLHSWPLAIVAFMIWVWSHIWHLPKDFHLSWRGVVLHIARWPVVLSALVQVILKVQKPYMITVKGLQYGTKRPFQLAVYAPYFIMMSISLFSCWFYLIVYGQGPAQANLLFALQGTLAFMVVYIIALMKDLTEIAKDGIAFTQYILLRIKALCMLLMFLVLFTVTGLLCFNNIIQAIAFSRGF